MTYMTGLRPKELITIKDRMPVFKKVQDLTGVPWEAIGAVWYREASLKTRVDTPGGPFQFDPPDKFEGFKGNELLRVLIGRYSTIKDPVEVERIVKLGVNDFENGALLCALWLRYGAKWIITPDATDEVIKDAFYGYNGRKYGSIDKSPYVMNGYDKNHYPMKISGSIPAPTPTNPKARRRVNTDDFRCGAFLVYKLLCRDRKPKAVA